MGLSPRFTTCLWFDSQAEDAAAFYISIFQNSKIVNTSRYGEAGQEIHGKTPGSVLTVEFELDGFRFIALNGGPHFQFSEAVSLVVNCETQAEVDYYWEKLTADANPNAQQCGWLKDRFGVSWQVVPEVVTALLALPPSPAQERVMNAIFDMKKIDIAALEAAYAG